MGFFQNNKKIKFSQTLLGLLEVKALALRDQQTAMQPRQPQGSATIMIKIVT